MDLGGARTMPMRRMTACLTDARWKAASGILPPLVPFSNGFWINGRGGSAPSDYENNS